ncbi:MAG: hypothetical protein LBT80_05405 [Lactobacillaceae bacterium]|jgi:hypothetical protein|nr:hypothetical protein [Lactobacillaceae bacterium]
MEHTSRILLSVLLLSTASQIVISAPVFADTYTWNGSGGSWASSEDGATDVSTTVLSSYTVRIPAALTLPTTDTYTTAADNVEVLPGAQIQSDQSIRVKLGAGQTFLAANGGNDAVAYKVKLADNTKLTGTTDAYEILKVEAETAHQTGGTTSVNVGFDTAPDFKFAGIYTDHVQFDVSVKTSPVILNGDGTVTFAGARWKILVDGDSDAAEATHAGDYLVVRETVLTNREIGGSPNDYDASVQFGSFPASSYFSASGENGYQRSHLKTRIDYYAANILSDEHLAQGVLPVNLNDMSFWDFVGDDNPVGVYPVTNEPTNWEAYNPASDIRGATTVDAGGTKQAFALSYGDLHSITGVGPSVHGSKLLQFADGMFSMTRSPGSDYQRVGFIDDAGAFDQYVGTWTTYPVRPAFWLTTN